MPRTSCSYMSRVSDSVISRCARRERRLRQLIGRRLVVADFFEVGLRADLVERAFEKHLVGRDARHVEAARRHEIDLLGSRRQVVLTLAGVFEVRRNALARLAEIEHGVADFLNLSPVRRLEWRGDDQHRVDARVVLGAPQRLDIAAQRSARARLPSPGPARRWGSSRPARRQCAESASSGRAPTDLSTPSSTRRRRPEGRRRRTGRRGSERT